MSANNHSEEAHDLYENLELEGGEDLVFFIEESLESVLRVPEGHTDIKMVEANDLKHKLSYQLGENRFDLYVKPDTITVDLSAWFQSTTEDEREVESELTRYSEESEREQLSKQLIDKLNDPQFVFSGLYRLVPETVTVPEVSVQERHESGSYEPGFDIDYYVLEYKLYLELTLRVEYVL